MRRSWSSKHINFSDGDSWIVTERRICRGQPHIRGTRIRVEEVALWHERLDLSIAEIVSRNPQLTAAAVEAAVAYYADHQHEFYLPLSSADALASSPDSHSALRAQVTRPAEPSGALAPVGATTHEGPRH